ncbi:HAD domain-containing protein [Brevibacterium litoralis]|uniref:HAD domain-containing protein n=1 Tax=Brevibacterium litoralis TaxID=3138935 RepID=UPI0032EE0D86
MAEQSSHTTDDAVSPDSPVSFRRRARKVTVFLDVDGVLNSYPVPRLRFLRERRKRVHAWKFVLDYRPKIVRWLEKLVATRQVEIVWLSTWSHRCTTEIEPKLGFTGTYDVIPMPDDTMNRYAGDPNRWWKARAVEDWFAAHPGERVVWIDDDLAAPVTRAYFADTYTGRLLMVAPRFVHGLGEEHFRAILDFTYPRKADT